MIPDDFLNLAAGKFRGLAESTRPAIIEEARTKIDAHGSLLDEGKVGR